MDAQQCVDHPPESNDDATSSDDDGGDNYVGLRARGQIPTSMEIEILCKIPTMSCFVRRAGTEAMPPWVQGMTTTMMTRTGTELNLAMRLLLRSPEKKKKMKKKMQRGWTVATM